MTNEQIAIRTTWLSIGGNALLAGIKGLAGFFGNSHALIADAIESLTDIFSSFLILLGIRYAAKPADKNHPYGHGKIEPLITFIVTGALILSALYIASESIRLIRTPHEAPAPWTLLVLGTIILWKEIAYRLVLKKSKEVQSTALQAEAWHHRSDAFTSIAAFLGITIALVLGKGYETADDWAALVAAAVIVYNSYRIFRPALAEVMDENRYNELIHQIREIAVTVQGVEGTEKCYIRKAGLSYHLDLHAIVQSTLTVKEGHSIAHLLTDKLRQQLPQLGHISVHIEPDEY